LLQAELEEPEALRYILGRNEQAMVHTAVAYARMKNRLQTYAVSTSVGPGATNMLTGAALATINRLPVLLLPGCAAALLVLAVLALLTLATNAFALIFLLPSLHAWLWLPQVRHSAPWVRAGVLGLGFLGPAILLGSFAWRFELGFDAPWYVLELVAIGYVPLPAIVIALGWFAAAGQLAAIATGRYAPYPEARERPPRGPLRQLVGRLLGLALGRKPTELKRAVGS
jgi:hypothetical protein